MKAKQQIVKIDQWSIIQSGDEYTPPELRKMRLCGKVSNHPTERLNNREMVMTSAVVEVNKRIVTTRNTVYRLGKIDPEYRKWLKENYDKDWNWRNPIRVYGPSTESTKDGD